MCLPLQKYSKNYCLSYPILKLIFIGHFVTDIIKRIIIKKYFYTYIINHSSSILLLIKFSPRNYYRIIKVESFRFSNILFSIIFCN